MPLNYLSTLLSFSHFPFFPLLLLPPFLLLQFLIFSHSKVLQIEVIVEVEAALFKKTELHEIFDPTKMLLLE